MKNNVLICGVNWLGDTLMLLPAIRKLKRAQPECELTVMSRPFLLPLWEMAGVASACVELERGLRGTWRTVGRIRRSGCRSAYVFPNSFRSAMLPFLGLVPERVGLPGHQRVWMLTRVATIGTEAELGHQALEYFDIVGVRPDPSYQEDGRLTVPPKEAEAAATLLGSHASGGALIAMIPGAARGASKCWSEANFVETGRILCGAGARIVVFGSGGEQALCGRIAAGIGAACLNLAGRTSLVEMGACLARCRVAVANDSGGMHMAAAVGTRVVAIYGITDPAKTGPMGQGHAVLVAPGVRGNRKVPRRSMAAAAALQSISPEQVAAAVRERL